MNKKTLFLSIIGFAVLLIAVGALWFVVGRSAEEPVSEMDLPPDEPAGFVSNIQFTVESVKEGVTLRVLASTTEPYFRIDAERDPEKISFTDPDVVEGYSHPRTFIQGHEGVWFRKEAYAHDYFFRGDKPEESFCDLMEATTGSCLFLFDYTAMNEGTDFLNGSAIAAYWGWISEVLAAHREGRFVEGPATLEWDDRNLILDVTEIATETVRVPYPEDAIPFRDIIAYDYRVNSSIPLFSQLIHRPDDAYLQEYIDAWREALLGNEFYAFDAPDDVVVDWALGTITWPEVKTEDGTPFEPVYAFDTHEETRLLESLPNLSCVRRSDVLSGARCESPQTNGEIAVSTSNNGVYYATFFADFTWQRDEEATERRIGPYAFVPIFEDAAVTFSVENVYFEYPPRVAEDLLQMILPSLELKEDVDEMPKFGFATSYTGDSIEIAAVSPGTPAEAAGLMPGDMLVEVDGVRVEGFLPETVDELIDDPDKRIIEFVVVRPPRQETLTISIIRGPASGGVIATSRMPKETLREIGLNIDSDYVASKAARQIDRNFSTGEALTLHAYAFGLHAGSNPDGAWDRTAIRGVELGSGIATRLNVDPSQIDLGELDIIVRAHDPLVENAAYFADNPDIAAQYPAEPENFALYYTYKTTWRSYTGSAAVRYDIPPGGEVQYRIAVEGIVPRVERQ